MVTQGSVRRVGTHDGRVGSRARAARGGVTLIRSTAAAPAPSPSVNALFLNHSEQRCGVYQMGVRIGRALEAAGVATYVELTEHAKAVATVEASRPRAIIYNWHPATIPWAPDIVRRFPTIKHLGLIHEISPENPAANADVFPYRVVSDPSFPANGSTLFRTIRHVPRTPPLSLRSDDRITVGSFGFAVGGKMFHAIVDAVGREFPGARMRIRIPSAHFGDDAGAMARHAAEGARSVGADVSLEVEHDFLPEDQLVRWLASNDLNVFFYDYNPGRGISSVIDYAIAACRPIAINGSQMFRHVAGVLGTYPDKTLRDSLEFGHVVRELYEQWSPERMASEYRSILSAIGCP